MARLEAEEDRVKREVLRELIEERVLADEEKKRGISVEALLGAEVDAKAKAVSDDDVSAPRRRRENAARSRGCARRRAESAAFVAELEKRADVRVFLAAPRQTIETKGRPALGADNAPVTVVFFSDFQCPYCKRAAETLQELQREYGDRTRLVFRHFPLPSHERARQAAEAAECAGMQGKFWPMHDRLFADPRKLSDADLAANARAIGADPDAFARCVAGLARKAVDDDLRAGEALGVDGTPAVYVNGRLATVRTTAALRRLIDEELNENAKSPAR